MNCLALLLALFLAPQDSATESAFERGLDELPPPARVDWLVQSPDRRAGVFRTGRPHEIALDNGLVRRTFRVAPNGATVGLDDLTTGKAWLRGVKPEAWVEIDGEHFAVGGLVGQPNYAYLKPEWLDGLQSDPQAFQLVRVEVGEPEERMAWKRVRHHAPDVAWPPRGVALRMDYERTGSPVAVSVHYELYDGIPCFSKWITVHNRGAQAVTVDRFASEVLAAVEHSSIVESRGVALPTPDLLVETDYAFGGMTAANTSRFSVHWETDPDYSSQVSYRRVTPCLLEVKPTIGPAQTIEPGGTFESFHAFVLVPDSTDRERLGLSQRRMYRTIAPWVTENPLMMHVRYSDWDTVKNAIDQCAEVGFEMVILTFGSGFNIENDSPEYLAEMRRYADYARSKGIEIGGYSLLSSRHVQPDGDNCVHPETGETRGTTHGSCPALASGWGQAYFAKLYRFYEESGFALLEHDGSYPGDLDAAARPPLQKGVEDSRWVQWRIIADFYRWCRGRGIYLNVPDYYYLSGSTKCGMGYREVNWSLPRAQQVLHTRQNIFDGTWQKTPSMGWMFVPLTQYHGGGAAAVIEPLVEHLDHYERMLYCNLALGVQACYRGPRLYDAPQTRDLVKKWVDWYREYRDILESDVIHGRRADGRDVDWVLHVNPRLDRKGMLVAFNPLPEVVTRRLRVNLYYTGLVEVARVRHENGEPVQHPLARDYTIELDVTVPAEGMTWYAIE